MLTADLLRLGDELEALDAAGIELAHVDVMDGVFCPHDDRRAAVREGAARPLRQGRPPDDRRAARQGARLRRRRRRHHHASTSSRRRHPHRVLQSLAGTGVVRGVALNPGTPLAAVEPLLDELELMLLLAVNPGWGGQSFIPSTERRIAETRALVADREIVVAVDGGITRANVEHVASLGVDLIVTGSAVYDGVRTGGEAHSDARGSQAGPHRRWPRRHRNGTVMAESIGEASIGTLMSNCT